MKHFAMIALGCFALVSGARADTNRSTIFDKCNTPGMGVPDRLLCIEDIADAAISAANKRADDAVARADAAQKRADEAFAKAGEIEAKLPDTSKFVVAGSELLVTTRGWCLSWWDERKPPLMVQCDRPDLQRFKLLPVN